MKMDDGGAHDECDEDGTQMTMEMMEMTMMKMHDMDMITVMTTLR